MIPVPVHILSVSQLPFNVARGINGCHQSLYRTDNPIVLKRYEDKSGHSHRELKSTWEPTSGERDRLEGKQALQGCQRRSGPWTAPAWRRRRTPHMLHSSLCRGRGRASSTVTFTTRSSELPAASRMVSTLRRPKSAHRIRLDKEIRHAQTML